MTTRTLTQPAAGFSLIELVIVGIIGAIAKLYRGPDLRRIPSAPGGANPGATGVGSADGPGIGWVYDEVNGWVFLNRGNVVNTNVEDEALGRLRVSIGL